MIYILLSFYTKSRYNVFSATQSYKKKTRYSTVTFVAIDQKIPLDRSISAYTLPRNQFLSLSLSFSLVRNRFQEKANNPKPRKIPVPQAIKGYSTSCARPAENSPLW